MRMHTDPSSPMTPMQPMRVVGMSRGFAPHVQNFVRRRRQAMVICSGFAVLIMVLVVFVNTPIVSTLLRMDLERTSLRAAWESDNAIARATAIRRRPSHGAKYIQGDLQVLQELVRVEKVLDSAYQKGIALALRETKNPATVHKNAELQREILKDKKELEGAIVAVTLAIEDDTDDSARILDRTGHPFDGLRGRIAELSERLVTSAGLQDNVLARSEAEAERVAQLPARDQSKGAVAKGAALRARSIKAVAQLQELQEDLVGEISAVVESGRPH